MKLLAIIWLAAAILSVSTIRFVNDTFSMVEKATYAYQLQPAEAVDLGNSTCVQNCQPIQLQPAKAVN